MRQSTFILVVFGLMARVIAMGVPIGLILHMPVHADNYKLGIVTQNAFLVSKEPEGRLHGNPAHDLVGYLPIGTRVYFKDETVTINNLVEGKPEKYYFVFSSIGFEGLLREDLFTHVQDNRIAVVVGRTAIRLHNPDPKKGEYKGLLTMGRYDNAYLEIIGELPNHYDALLRRRNPPNSLPASERVRLWKEHVRMGWVVIIDPKDRPQVPKWAERGELDGQVIATLLARGRQRLKEKAETAMGQFISDQSIECLVKESADFKLAVGFLRNGLSYELDLNVKDYDQIFRFAQRRLEMDGTTTTYLLMTNVKCRDGVPERLQRLTLQEGSYDPQKRTSVRLEDIKLTSAKWVTSLGAIEHAFRMVRVDGEQHYMQLLNRLEELVERGNSFIVRELTNEQQDVLIHLILKEISYFSHRTDLFPETGK